MFDQNVQQPSDLDLITIERDARAMQARAIAEMFASLRRSIAARLHRGAAAHTA